MNFKSLFGRDIKRKHNENGCKCEPFMEAAIPSVQEGRFVDAIRCYESALKICPGNHKAWGNKGLCLDQLGNSIQALDCYSRAIDIDRSYAFAWNNKGICLIRLGRNEEGLNCFLKAIDLNPKYVDALINCGTALISINEWSKAAIHLERALVLDPGNKRAQTNKILIERELAKCSIAESSNPKDSVETMISAAQAQGWLRDKDLGFIPEIMNIYEGAADYFEEFIDDAEPAMQETLVYYCCRYLFAKGVEGIILWGMAPNDRISFYFHPKHLFGEFETKVPSHLHDRVVDSLVVGESLFKAHQQFVIQRQQTGQTIDLGDEIHRTLRWIPRLGIAFALHNRYDALR